MSKYICVVEIDTTHGNDGEPLREPLTSVLEVGDYARTFGAAASDQWDDGLRPATLVSTPRLMSDAGHHDEESSMNTKKLGAPGSIPGPPSNVGSAVNADEFSRNGAGGPAAGLREEVTEGAPVLTPELVSRLSDQAVAEIWHALREDELADEEGEHAQEKAGRVLSAWAADNPEVSR